MECVTLKLMRAATFLRICGHDPRPSVVGGMKVSPSPLTHYCYDSDSDGATRMLALLVRYLERERERESESEQVSDDEVKEAE